MSTPCPWSSSAIERSAQVCTEVGPAETANAPDNPLTATGTDELVFVPLQSTPSPLSPQTPAGPEDHQRAGEAVPGGDGQHAGRPGVRHRQRDRGLDGSLRGTGLPQMLWLVIVSVTFTVTSSVPESNFGDGVPDSTPVDDSTSPAGRALAGATTAPLPHVTVVVYPGSPGATPVTAGGTGPKDARGTATGRRDVAMANARVPGSMPPFCAVCAVGGVPSAPAAPAVAASPDIDITTSAPLTRSGEHQEPSAATSAPLVPTVHVAHDPPARRPGAAPGRGVRVRHRDCIHPRDLAGPTPRPGSRRRSDPFRTQVSGLSPPRARERVDPGFTRMWKRALGPRAEQAVGLSLPGCNLNRTFDCGHGLRTWGHDQLRARRFGHPGRGYEGR